MVGHTIGHRNPKPSTVYQPVTGQNAKPLFVIHASDYALDMHTMKGNAMGRGLDHFRKEGAKLVPPPTADDPYEDEAYRLWTIKAQDR